MGEFGGRWLLTISLLDTKKDSALGRSTKTAKVQGELVDLMGPAVADVLKARPGFKPATPAPASVSEAAQPMVTAKDVVDPGSTRRTAGWALVGGGAALLAGGGVAGILALTDASAGPD